MGFNLADVNFLPCKPHQMALQIRVFYFKRTEANDRSQEAQFGKASLPSSFAHIKWAPCPPSVSQVLSCQLEARSCAHEWNEVLAFQAAAILFRADNIRYKMNKGIGKNRSFHKHLKYHARMISCILHRYVSGTIQALREAAAKPCM